MISIEQDSEEKQERYETHCMRMLCTIFGKAVSG